MNTPFAPWPAGLFLLTLPGIPGPRFAHAVVALCVRDAEGAPRIGPDYTCLHWPA